MEQVKVVGQWLGWWLWLWRWWWNDRWFYHLPCDSLTIFHSAQSSGLLARKAFQIDSTWGLFFKTQECITLSGRRACLTFLSVLNFDKFPFLSPSAKSHSVLAAEGGNWDTPKTQGQTAVRFQGKQVQDTDLEWGPQGIAWARPSGSACEMVEAGSHVKGSPHAEYVCPVVAHPQAAPSYVAFDSSHHRHPGHRAPSSQF